MLELPVWKFCALVEHWLYANTEPENWDELTRELERPVDFTWIRDTNADGSEVFKEPARWQQNKPGESLLSAHRQSKGGE